MNHALSSHDHAIDIDDGYRRASALDASHPSEWVRRRVFAHAVQLGAERALRDSVSARAPRSTGSQSAGARTIQLPGRFVLFGASAIGAVAVIAVAWVLLSPRSSPDTATDLGEIPSSEEPIRLAGQAPLQATDMDEESMSQATPAAGRATASPAAAPESTPANAQTSVGGHSSAESPPETSLRLQSLSAARVAKRTKLAAAETASAEQAAPVKSVRRARSAGTAQNSAGSSGTGGTGMRRVALDSTSASVARSDASVAVQAQSPPPGTAVAATATVPQADAVSTPYATPAPSAEPTQSADALWRAAESGDVGEIEATLNQHIDINARDAKGRTALMLAAVHGQTRALRALLSRGADPNVPDANNQTPLHVAKAEGQSRVVFILKQSGAR